LFTTGYKRLAEGGARLFDDGRVFWMKGSFWMGEGV
jgi:hypothetical protein